MNRKTLLALAAVAATSATFAAAVTATSVNTLCRIKVTTTTQETLIGLPLVDVRSTDGQIDVKSFVLTDGLPAGTTLQYKDGSTWRGWYLPEGTPRTWTPVLTTESSSIQPGSSDAVKLARGGCVVLTLPEKPAGSQSFYLYGQFVEETISGLALSQGYNLVGNPGTGEVTSENIAEKCGITPAANDQVIVPFLATYQDPANNNASTTIQLLKYCTFDGENWNRTFIVEPGQGFWYKKAAADTP